MAKSKNHTAHNQNRKAHRNGILKAPVNYYSSTKGMDPKFLRNQRFAKKKSPKPCVQRQIAKNRTTMAQKHKEAVRKRFLDRKIAAKAVETAKTVANFLAKQKRRKEKRLLKSEKKPKKERKPKADKPKEEKPKEEKLAKPGDKPKKKSTIDLP